MTVARQALTLRADCHPFSRFLPTAQPTAGPTTASMVSSSAEAATTAVGHCTAASATTAEDAFPNTLGKPGLSCRRLKAEAAATGAAAGAPARGPHAMLDLEGRALITEHSGMIVVNTYCPASGTCWERLAFKMHFLHGLRAVMLQQRSARSVDALGLRFSSDKCATRPLQLIVVLPVVLLDCCYRLSRRKPVVLMGDINATTNCKDAYLMQTTIDIRSLWPQHPSAAGAGGWTPCPALPLPLQKKLLEGGPLIERLLRNSQYFEVRHFRGWGSKQQQQPQGNPGQRRQDSYRFFLKPPGLRQKQIGKP